MNVSQFDERTQMVFVGIHHLPRSRDDFGRRRKVSLDRVDLIRVDNLVFGRDAHSRSAL